jgi:N-acylneuraminate cytidylyltransferase
MNVLAIVPARGGSKSIPRKNIRLLGGIPLIAYSIAAGLEASNVSRVIVSTDDEEIASVARKWGAETPFMRPSDLAGDFVTDMPVFQHAVQWLQQNEGYKADIIVQLRPTTPFRSPEWIDAAINLLLDNEDADSVRGVAIPNENPFKMWTIEANGLLKPLIDIGISESYNMPRQLLPTVYWHTGHLDVVRYQTLMDKNSLTGRVVLPLVLDPAYITDIDTPTDWRRAELMLSTLDIPIVQPLREKEQHLGKTRLLVLDFDGVVTDNRVWVDENGREMVAANRSDGMGIAMLQKIGVEVVVLSTESNPVVAARCRKLGVSCLQGLANKAAALQEVVMDRKLLWAEVIYVGNDVNDEECLRLVGTPIVVADAHPHVKQDSRLVLSSNGGYGAVREVCDLILSARQA